MRDQRRPIPILLHRRSEAPRFGWLAIPAIFLVAALLKSGSPELLLKTLAAGLGMGIVALGFRSFVRRKPADAVPYPPPLSGIGRKRRAAPDAPAAETPPARTISRSSVRAPLPPGASLGDLLVRLRADFASDATARHVAFDFRMHGGLEQAPLDIHALHVVLGHLVENALHHAPGGSLIEIRATPSRTGRSARISVSDDGEGIDESARGRLFTDPHVPHDATASTIVRARSLIACRERLERLGGAIAYEARTPRGSRFIVEMPIDSSFLGTRRTPDSRQRSNRA